VFCTAAVPCVAVGSYSTKITRPLVERRS
jgi:hypothetical protein